jgi:hypothetical protein
LDWTGLADEIALDALSPEEAVSFLQSRAGRQDAEGARILAEALGYLPLALDHAAAYCKRAQVSFGEYAKKVATLMVSAPRDVLYPRSVAATFDLALGEAEARSPAAEEVIGVSRLLRANARSDLFSSRIDQQGRGHRGAR